MRAPTRTHMPIALLGVNVGSVGRLPTRHRGGPEGAVEGVGAPIAAAVLPSCVHSRVKRVHLAEHGLRWQLRCPGCHAGLRKLGLAATSRAAVCHLVLPHHATSCKHTGRWGMGKRTHGESGVTKIGVGSQGVGVHSRK
jgi:hypothetical protein